MADFQVEDEEWVKERVMEYDGGKTISKILSVSAEAAVPKGSNYGSDLFRLKLKVALPSGEVEERPVIYKAMPTTPGRRWGAERSGYFPKEAKVYQDLLPALDRIQKKSGDDEPIYPRCYAVKPNKEGFLLEDISVQGYKLSNKMKGLDFEHARLSLIILAKFHALAAKGIEDSDIISNDYGTLHYADSSNDIHNLIGTYLDDLATVLETKWRGEWTEFAERVRTFKEAYRNDLSKDFKVDESKFYTITHGDYNNINVLFAYGSDGRPTSARLLDFQMVCKGRPGADIHYFLQTSLSPGTLIRKPELLRVYYDSLVHHLQRYNYSSGMPTFEDIKDGYDRAARLATAVPLAFRPYLICESEDAPDIEEVCKSYNSERKLFESENEDFIKSLKAILKDANERGYL